MNSVWFSLVWKEWREHRWKMAAFVAVLLAGVLGCLFAAKVDRAGYFSVVMLSYAPIAAVFLAMGIAAGERSQRTLPLLRAMPLNLPGLTVLKLLMATATFLTPIVIAVLVLLAMVSVGRTLGWDGAERVADELWRGPAFIGAAWLEAIVQPSLFGVSILCWVAALGVNRESEVRAAAVGLVGVLGLWAAFIATVALVDLCRSDASAKGLYDTSAGRAIIQTVTAAMPGGVAFVTNMRSFTGWGVAGAACLLMHGALAAWYVFRFGRATNTNPWSPKPTAKGALIAEWLDKPWSSPLRALVWKQLREGGPIIAAGLACAVGVATFSGFTTWQAWQETRHYDMPYLLNEMATTTSAILVGFGYLSGLIAGVGASTSDLQPGLLGFWRSRPIDADKWFWSKCVVTVAMLFAAFVAPGALVWGGMLITMPSGHQENYIEGQTLNILGMLTTPMLLGFASSMLAGCLLSHTVYTAVLGLAMSLGLIAAFVSRIEDGSLYHLVWMHAGIFFIAVLMILAAWLAVRSDWALGR